MIFSKISWHECPGYLTNDSNKSQGNGKTGCMLKIFMQAMDGLNQSENYTLTFDSYLVRQP
jgi:hypothetical protein